MAIITGTSGNDSILPSGNSAGVSGGVPSNADDTVNATFGTDTLDGGGGFNVLNYSGIGSPIAATFSAYGVGVVGKAGGQTDIFSNFYRINAGSGADTLIGPTGFGSFAISLRGNAGNDTIDGAGSRGNTADYFNSPAAISVNLALGSALDGWGASDTLINVRRVQLSSFNDTVIGGAFGDIFVLGLLGNHSIDGGESSDRGNEVRYSVASSVSVDLGVIAASGGGYTNTVNKSNGTVDTLTRISRVVAGSAADTLTGTPGNDVLEGEAGNDLLMGRSGYDYAGFASWTISAPISQGVIVNLTTGNATDPWGGTDTLVEIEAAFGNSFADDLTGVNLGFATRSRLEALGGNDVLRGAASGFTSADYRGAPSAVIVNLTSGSASDGYGNTDTLIGIKAADGSAFSDALTGSTGDDWLLGGAGNDSIKGEAGFDRLLGEDGNDTIEGGADGDVITGGTGQDTLTGGTGSDRFNFTLNATPGNHSSRTTQDTITDFSTVEGDYIRLTSAGAAKADIIFAGLVAGTFADINTDITLPAFVQPAGIDALNAYVIQHTTTGGWVVVDENSNGTLEASEFAVRLNGGTMSQVRVNGSTVVTAAFVGDGTSNTIFLSDTVAGGARGLAGDDVIYGGGLFDNMGGGLGNDQFVVRNRDTTLIELLDEGEDTAWVGIDQFTNSANIEIVRMFGTAQRLQGSATAEQIVANGSIASHLLGGGGDDVLWSTNNADTLDGGDGNDTFRGTGGADSMYGGLGDDAFVVSDTAAKVFEYLGGGYDTVYVTSASFTLGDNIEEARLSFTGANILIGGATPEALKANPLEASTLEGRGGNDVLYGSEFADTLRGGIGDDIIYGAGGADVVVGGTGNDQFVVLSGNSTFVEFAGEGYDIGYLGGSGSYTISVEIEEFRLYDAVVNLTYTGPALNKFIVGNQTPGLGNNINAGAGDDIIYGGTGNDTILGGTGNDTFYFEGGADRLVVGITNSGTDQVAGFSTAAGAKMQFLAGSGITAFNQLAINSAGGNTQVNFNGQTTLFFGATLSQSDFIFG